MKYENGWGGPKLRRPPWAPTPAEIAEQTPLVYQTRRAVLKLSAGGAKRREPRSEATSSTVPPTAGRSLESDGPHAVFAVAAEPSRVGPAA